MGLRKQSIRRINEVTVEGKKTTKEELIELSLDWVEKELILFKKVLAQGGSCKIKGKTYRVSKEEPIRMVVR
tara:strand:+ start:526 stop:741 length:216 start_codon:yes stop_codon:yes gene_type:complete